MAYKVEWDDHEGNRQERTFDTEEEARLECAALLKNTITQRFKEQKTQSDRPKGRVMRPLPVTSRGQNGKERTADSRGSRNLKGGGLWGIAQNQNH